MQSAGCRATRIVLMAMAVLWRPSAAHADGGYFPVVTTGATAETTNQRALLLFEAGYTTLIIQTGYKGSGDNFSWVIPTAALVTSADVDVITAPIFDNLHAETAPMLVSFTEGCGAFGCAGSSTSSSAGASSEVRLFDTFTVGNYDIKVLSATDSQSLTNWLTTNGYRAPAAAASVFSDYVSRGYYFLAVRFTKPIEAPESTGGDADTTPPDDAAKPLSIRFAGDMRIFPLLISSLSTTDTADLVLYTIDTRRYAVLNFPTVDMNITDEFKSGDFTTWYEQHLDAAIAANGGNAFMVEYAATIDGYDLANILGRTPDMATAAPRAGS